MPLKWTLLALAAASCVAAQEPTPTPAASQPATTIPVGASEVPTDDLLDAMEKVGTTMKSLSADVAMTETDEQSGDDSTRTGKLQLQRRGPGDTRGHVLFEKLLVQTGTKKRLIDEKVEYLLDGDWVIDRAYGRGANDPAGKRETRRQIRPPGDKTDLLKLGEGPFPLPIGQPRDAVHQQFEVTKLPPDDQEKPGLVGLELRPKESNRLSRRFETVTVWVDPNDAMPRVVETVAAGGGPSRITKLSNVRINEGVTDADFTLPPVGEDWRVTTEEWKP